MIDVSVDDVFFTSGNKTLKHFGAIPLLQRFAQADMRAPCVYRPAVARRWVMGTDMVLVEDVLVGFRAGAYM